MGIEKIISYAQTVTEDGSIQVQRATRIMEDGEELAKAYHNHVVDPGDDFTAEDDRTKLIAGVVHTEDCVAEFNVKKEKAKLKWKL
jgi:hypothetical protein